MITDWHDRFQQQAKWTQDLRTYLYKLAKLQEGQRVLDLGCGTGALMGDLGEKGLHGFGVDIDFSVLDFASKHNPNSTFSQGNAYHLPYEDKTFDLAFCHFVLMWLSEPAQAITEMVRVTKKTGMVMAFAEPDYGGRIDYPAELNVIGQMQIESLKVQGADPFMGRRLSGIFHNAGLVEVRTGVVGGQWSDKSDLKGWETEWEVFEADANRLPYQNVDLAALKNAEKSAQINGMRVLFIPTFYALGVVQ